MTVEGVAAVLGVVLTLLALTGVLWRYVLLPNLREQLFDPVKENHRQLTENRHTNHEPTLLDRLDDLENHIELVALNQLALLKRVGTHIGDSEADRARLWLIIDSLIHDRKEP